MDILLDNKELQFLKDQYTDPETPENKAVNELITLRRELQDAVLYIRTADGLEFVYQLRIRGLVK